MHDSFIRRENEGIAGAVSNLLNEGAFKETPPSILGVDQTVSISEADSVALLLLHCQFHHFKGYVHEACNTTVRPLTTRLQAQ